MSTLNEGLTLPFSRSTFVKFMRRYRRRGSVFALFLSFLATHLFPNEAFKRLKALPHFSKLEKRQATEIVGFFYEDREKLGKNAPVPAQENFSAKFI